MKAFFKAYFSWNAIALHGFALAALWSTASAVFNA